MEKKHEDLNFSYAIMWCNLFLSILIVFLHTNVPSLELYSPQVINFWGKVDSGIGVIADVAVPSYFVISAYLLFRKFAYANYFDLVFKRARTVLLPYFIWSFIGAMYQSVLCYIRQDGYISILQATLTGECNGPLWFLRCLFVLVLVSPVLYWVIGITKKSIVLVFLLIVINLCMDFSYSSFVFWTPCYTFGAWLAIYQKDKIEATTMQITKMDHEAIKCLIGAILFFFGFFTLSAPKLYYLYRMFGSIVVLYYFWKHTWSHMPQSILQNSFFTYCSHVLLLGLIPKLLSLVFPHNIFGIVALFLCSAIMIWLVTVVVAQIIKKTMPWFYGILTGGRLDREAT